MAFLYSSQIPRLCMWSDHLLNPSLSLTQKIMWELWFRSVPAAVQSVLPVCLTKQVGIALEKCFAAGASGDCSVVQSSGSHLDCDDLSHHTRCAQLSAVLPGSGCAQSIMVASVNLTPRSSAETWGNVADCDCPVIS